MKSQDEGMEESLIDIINIVSAKFVTRPGARVGPRFYIFFITLDGEFNACMMITLT